MAGDMADAGILIKLAPRISQGVGMRTAKVIQVSVQDKTIILECPKHGIPYKVKASKNPINEGNWRHFFCERCRKEKASGQNDHDRGAS